jgi:putative transposase
MKGERIRCQQTGEFHFLTFSCFRRRTYLSTVAAMELFEDALKRVRLHYLFAVAGYVVMPEHVYLLVNEPRRGLLSRTVQALKLSVSMRRRERPFWQAHYYDFNVTEHEKFVEKLRSIHRNPVRRGLVEKPEDCHPTDEDLSVRTPAEMAELSPLSDWYARNRRDRIRMDSPRERLATARVDALPAV